VAVFQLIENQRQTITEPLIKKGADPNDKESVLNEITVLIDQGQKRGTNPNRFITFEEDELPL
jgi:hypothetical protein